MNPIEQCWAYMKMGFDFSAYASFEDFKEAVIARWEAIDIDFIHRLIDSMPERVKDLRAAKGKWTAW
jgi:hypothetical protein